MVFYRKYRPQKFSDLVGQKQIVESLLSQLAAGKVSHGYLFCGPRGTGKTSTARILAKAVNCEVYGSQLTAHSKQTTNNKQLDAANRFGEPCNKCQSCISITDGSSLDVIEIDAASNRGIDEIRDLREKVKLSPVSSRFKVYIIDEAHMLTMEAFNAFLKTLEEPPGHVIFIMCTTAPAKLPATIISRLSRFNFSRATGADLVEALGNIAKKENLKIEKVALLAIAKIADGSFRDAASILDQLVAGKKSIKEDDVLEITMFSSWNQVADFVDMISKKDLKKAVDFVEKIFEAGGDVSILTKEAILFLEKLLLVKIGSSPEAFDESDDQIATMEKLAQSFEFIALQNLMKLLLVAEGEIKVYPLPQIPLVLAICKYCGEPTKVNSSQLIIDSLEVEQSNKPHDLQKKEKLGRFEVSVLKDYPAHVTKNIVGNAKAVKSLERIENKWGDFLARIKPINAHLVALLRSSRPIEFDGTNLTIEVFFRFHKEKLEEPKIRDLLSEQLEETMGAPVRINLILAQRQAGAPKAVVASDVAEVGGDELSKIAQEIFSE